MILPSCLRDGLTFLRARARSRGGAQPIDVAARVFGGLELELELEQRRNSRARLTQARMHGGQCSPTEELWQCQRTVAMKEPWQYSDCQGSDG